MSGHRAIWSFGVLVLLASGCQPAGTPEGQSLVGANLVLVTLDTTRADRLGCYGNERAITPTIDGLARDGVLARTAVAHAPITLPSHASLFTGVYPPQHGARANGTTVLAGSSRTLAEILSARGYATVAVIAAAVLEKRFGLDQGFDVYDDRGTAGGAFSHRPGEDVTVAALAAVARLPVDRPFFLWVHYFEPHAPYLPPADLRARFPDDRLGRYDAEIAEVDRRLGELLEGLRQRERRLETARRTLLVLTADHGEGLGSPHSEATHGSFVYEDTLRVPLLFAAPGALPSAHTVDGLVRHVDVLPTVLDLLGIEAPAVGPGRSLRAALEGRVELEGGVSSYAEALNAWETYGWSPVFHLRDERWKFIEAPRPELYDLAADPDERHDLYAPSPARAERMRAELAAIRRAGIASSAAAPELSPEERQQLVDLGYGVASGAREPVPSVLTELPDPKDLAGVYLELERADAHVRARDFDAALEAYLAVLERDPGNVHANLKVGDHHRNQRELARAEVYYRRVAERRPHSDRVSARIASLHEARAVRRARRGRNEEAVESLELALDAYLVAHERNPVEPLHVAGLGRVASRLGDVEAAERWLRAARDLAPGAFAPNAGLAAFLLEHGRLAEALPYYETAEAIGTDVERDELAMLVGFAEVRARTGDLRAGAELLDRALAAAPDHADAPEWRARRAALEGVVSGTPSR